MACGSGAACADISIAGAAAVTVRGMCSAPDLCTCCQPGLSLCSAAYQATDVFFAPSCSQREADGLVVATFYLPCLAQASYVVAHGDFAFIIVLCCVRAAAVCGVLIRACVCYTVCE